MNSEVEDALTRVSKGLFELYANVPLVEFPNHVVSVLSKLMAAEVSTALAIDLQSQQVFRTPLPDALGQQDHLILDLIRPHVLQAYQKVEACNQGKQFVQALNRLGSLILSRDGKVRWVSPRAEALINRFFPPTNVAAFQLPASLQAWILSCISQRTNRDPYSQSCPPLRIEQGPFNLEVRLIDDSPHDRFLLLLQEEQPQNALTTDLFKLLGLTDRQAEVLYWVAQGQSNGEIAKTLQCQKLTVKKHLENIYKKLGVDSRANAVTYALAQLGILQS